MSRISKFRPGHGTAVAYLALFVALGGTSYAVSTGSIDSREIKNGTVRGKDIKNGTVRSKDVGRSSLLAEDFKPGQLPRGPVGATGPTGARGPKGDPGSGSAFNTGSVSTSDYADQAALATLPALAAGRYVAFARVFVDSDELTPSTATCNLNVPGSADDEVLLDLGDDDASPEVTQRRMFSLMTTFSSTAAASVTVSCSQPTGGSHDATARIIAIRMN